MKMFQAVQNAKYADSQVASTKENIRVSREQQRQIAEDRSIEQYNKGYTVNDGTVQIRPDSPADFNRRKEQNTGDYYDAQDAWKERKQQQQQMQSQQKEIEELRKENLNQATYQTVSTILKGDVQPSTGFNSLVKQNKSLQNALQQDGISGIRQVNFDSDDDKGLLFNTVQPELYDTPEKKKAISDAYVVVDFAGKQELVGVLDIIASINPTGVPDKYRNEYVERLKSPYATADGSIGQPERPQQPAQPQGQPTQAAQQPSVPQQASPQRKPIMEEQGYNESFRNFLDNDILATGGAMFSDEAQKMYTNSQAMETAETNIDIANRGADLKELQHELNIKKEQADVLGKQADREYKADIAEEARISNSIKIRENAKKEDSKNTEGNFLYNLGQQAVEDYVRSEPVFDDTGKAMKDKDGKPLMQDVPYKVSYTRALKQELVRDREKYSKIMQRRSKETRQYMKDNNISAKEQQAFYDAVDTTMTLTRVSMADVKKSAEAVTGLTSGVYSMIDKIMGEKILNPDVSADVVATYQSMANNLIKSMAGSAVSKPEDVRVKPTTSSIQSWNTTEQIYAGIKMDLIRQKNALMRPFGKNAGNKSLATHEAMGAAGESIEALDYMINQIDAYSQAMSRESKKKSKKQSNT